MFARPSPRLIFLSISCARYFDNLSHSLVILFICVRGAQKPLRLAYIAIGDELLRRDLDNNCCVAADGCCCTGRWRAKTIAGGLRHRSGEYLGVLSAAGARYEGSRRRHFHRDSFPLGGTLTFIQDGRRYEISQSDF